MKYYIKHWSIWQKWWVEVTREEWLQAYRDRIEILREME